LTLFGPLGNDLTHGQGNPKSTDLAIEPVPRRSPLCLADGALSSATLEDRYEVSNANPVSVGERSRSPDLLIVDARPGTSIHVFDVELLVAADDPKMPP
jgi:hypothetical protein